MTVIALVIVCLPLAITATRAAVLQLPPRLEEAARGSGRSPLGVLATVGIPLTRAGILAGAALVFVAAIKELPVVVLLSPIEFSTLPLVIWQESTRAFFESGAIPALVLLLVTAPGVWLLVGRER
jgi:iron(III) transport system permease protein